MESQVFVRLINESFSYNSVPQAWPEAFLSSWYSTPFSIGTLLNLTSKYPWPNSGILKDVNCLSELPHKRKILLQLHSGNTLCCCWNTIINMVWRECRTREGKDVDSGPSGTFN